MECVILIGMQASGKSSFYRERFFDSHVRINLDMLQTRYREELLLAACLKGGLPFVVDNTNPTRQERARYLEPARAAGFTCRGYYFASQLEPCRRRNAARTAGQVVPEAGLRHTHRLLERPSRDEGFAVLWYVRIDEQRLPGLPGPVTRGELRWESSPFIVEEWQDEVR